MEKRLSFIDRSNDCNRKVLKILCLNFAYPIKAAAILLLFFEAERKRLNRIPHPTRINAFEKNEAPKTHKKKEYLLFLYEKI